MKKGYIAIDGLSASHRPIFFYLLVFGRFGGLLFDFLAFFFYAHLPITAMQADPSHRATNWTTWWFLLDSRKVLLAFNSALMS